MEKRDTFAHALSEILAKHKVISEAEGRALHRSFKNADKEQFDDFLQEEGLVEEEDLLKALAEYYQVPAVDVTGYFFDTQLLRNFPKDFLLRNFIIPLEYEDDILIIVANNPDIPDLLPELGKFTSEDIQFRVGLARDIADAVKEFYDKSLTDLPDDQEMDQEELEEEARYRALMNDDDEVLPTISPTVDNEEE